MNEVANSRLGLRGFKVPVKLQANKQGDTYTFLG